MNVRVLPGSVWASCGCSDAGCGDDGWDRGDWDRGDWDRGDWDRGDWDGDGRDDGGDCGAVEPAAANGKAHRGTASCARQRPRASAPHRAARIVPLLTIALEYTLGIRGTRAGAHPVRLPCDSYRRAHS